MKLKIDEALAQSIALHKKGKLLEAESLYRAILQSQPKHPHANHNLGVIAASLNKSETALSFFEIALEVNPNIEQFWISFIEALIKKEYFSKTKKILKKAQKSGVDQEKINLLTQQLISAIKERTPLQSDLDSLLTYYRDGRHVDAEKLARLITHQFPKNLISWKVLGSILKQTGRVLDALVSSQKVVELAPKDAEAHFNLGNTLRLLGRLEETVTSYRQAIALKPDFVEAHSNLGVTLSDLGRLLEAEESCRQATAMKQDYAEAHFNLGSTLGQLGRLKDAEISYRQAIELKPDYTDAHNNLGTTLKDLGRFLEAEVCLRQALTLKPDFTKAHYNLGNTLRNLGRLDNANICYRHAIALDPNYVKAHRNLGVTLRDLGKLLDSEASCRKALALEPGNADAHNNLGNTLSDLGRLLEAEASFRQAIAIRPDFADAHSNLGNILKELGRLETAKVSYKKAIELKPNFGEAYYNLGLLLLAVGHYEKAAENFKLSKFKDSEHYLLRCFYLQDEPSLFYGLLDYFINQGKVHPLIGSLGCRSALKYGINRPNLFCKNPLNYVLNANLSIKYDFGEVFVNPTKAILNGNRISKKTQYLLSNGYQTSGNLFLLEPNLTEEIEKIIHLEIDNYRIGFKNSKEGMITNWPTEYILYGWLVSMQSGGEIRPHMHEEGWISGSIYINVPSKLQNESGNLVVCIEEDQTVENINQRKSIGVVTGSLCLFPASLLHYTIPFESKEERIVLAFDVVPKY